MYNKIKYILINAIFFFLISPTAVLAASGDNSYMSKVMGMITSPIPYFVALVVAVIVVLIIVKQSKGKVTVDNKTYVTDGTFSVTNRTDDFVFTETKKTPKNKQ